MNLSEILCKKILSREEIIFLLSLEKEEETELLFRKAREVRSALCGDEVHLRGIIEFSNHCKQDCHYCGIRMSNPDIKRYRISDDEIIKLAEFIYESGIKTIVLQSGEDMHYSGEKVAGIIRRIKDNCDVAITLSLGEREFADYELWLEAGADRYLLKHETANAGIYNKIHPYQNLDERIRHLRFLKEIGYQTGSGNIIGLPGQNIGDIADDLLLCNELDVDMASFSPFLSAADTPLAGHKNCDIEIVLKTMAVARILLRNVHIPTTTALSTLRPDGRRRGLRAGANVIMPSYTPNDYRFNYLIYKNKPGTDEGVESKLQQVYDLLKDEGLKNSDSKGHSLKQL